MKNLLEYEEWLGSKFVQYAGETCEILSVDRSAKTVTILTKTGRKTVDWTDGDLSSLEEENHLTTFQQISAPTLGVY